MKTDIARTSGSPFDAIKRIRSDGSEYWLARELLPLMGYSRWEDFQTALERAKLAAQNSGMDVTSLFRRAPKKSGGRPREDYELERHAAYLVALNGDPRKPETAAGQGYFVVRTQQAEAVASLSVFDLMRAQIDQIEAAQREASEAKAIATKTEARVDALEGQHEWYSALGFARLNGIENTSTQFLNKVGRQATAIAKAHGIDPVKVPHALFGKVNSYPAWVWDLAFEGRSGS